MGRRITNERLIALMRNAFAISLFGVVMGAGLWLAGCSRSPHEVQAQQAPPPPPALKYIGAWGMKGTEPGQLEKPAAIAADVLGNVFIPDDGVNDFIHKFGPQGTPLLAFQEPRLTHPQSVDVDRGGAIYITDPVRGSLFIFFPNGDRYKELRVGGRPNAENILGVAVSDDGEIYVLDQNSGKIFDYTSRFRLARSWALPGSTPGVTRHSGAIASGTGDGGAAGALFVADPVGNQILRYAANGQLSSKISAAADGVARKISDQFAVSDKYIFVMDSDGRMVHVWTLEGKLELDCDLAPQLGQGSRFAPAIAASPRGELLVLDDREGRVLRYQIAF